MVNTVGSRVKKLKEAQKLVKRALAGDKAAEKEVFERSAIDRQFKKFVKALVAEHGARETGRGLRRVNYNSAGKRWPYRR